MITSILIFVETLGIAQDYEFIPRVRTVMVIEEQPVATSSSSSSDADSEDYSDWEVLPELTKSKGKRPSRVSYAAVVAK